MDNEYAARLDVDYPDELDRFTTFVRLIWVIPIAIIAALLSSAGGETIVNEAGDTVTTSSTGITVGLAIATMLMIAFRQKYPRWWFDFALEFTRFTARIAAYLALLTDQYPSTTDEQAVHLDVDYPDAEADLNRFLPLVKWILAIPHYIALILLSVAAVIAVIVAWFSILFTGRYPRSLFDFVVGVGRWGLRVDAYAFLLVTDQYPPFTLR